MVCDRLTCSYCSHIVRYSVHINCGGGETTIGHTIYEGDEVAGGAAKYVPIQEGWEVSTTGHFWDVNPSSEVYISKNVSILRMNNSQLYTTARLSPLSFIPLVGPVVDLPKIEDKKKRGGGGGGGV